MYTWEPAISGQVFALQPKALNFGGQLTLLTRCSTTIRKYRTYLEQLGITYPPNVPPTAAARVEQPRNLT
jgi:hypothetical protein